MPGPVAGFDPSSVTGTTTGSGSPFPGTSANLYADLAGITDAELVLPIYSGGKPTIGSDGKPITIAKQLQDFEAQPVAQREATAQTLVDKGFLTPAESRSPTAILNAYGKLLHYAALDPSKDLQTTVNSLPSIGSAGTAGTKIHAGLSNPLDVQYLGNAVAQKLVGRDLTPQEAMDITNIIRGQELTSARADVSQEQSLLAAQTGQGGRGGVISTEQPTSPEAATQQYLSTHDAGDVQAHSLLNVFEAIKSKVETDAQGSGPKAASGPVKVV